MTGGRAWTKLLPSGGPAAAADHVSDPDRKAPHALQATRTRHRQPDGGLGRDEERAARALPEATDGRDAAAPAPPYRGGRGSPGARTVRTAGGRRRGRRSAGQPGPVPGRPRGVGSGEVRRDPDIDAAHVEIAVAELRPPPPDRATYGRAGQDRVRPAAARGGRRDGAGGHPGDGHAVSGPDASIQVRGWFATMAASTDLRAGSRDRGAPF